jgi:Na+/proline symporter
MKYINRNDYLIGRLALMIALVLYVHFMGWYSFGIEAEVSGLGSIFEFSLIGSLIYIGWLLIGRKFTKLNKSELSKQKEILTTEK